MLSERCGQRLALWSPACKRATFRSLFKDYDAVRNGLTPNWSSGAVEGAVGRIKAIKRQMYCHANFDLLHRRAVLATPEVPRGLRDHGLCARAMWASGRLVVMDAFDRPPVTPVRLLGENTVTASSRTTGRSPLSVGDEVVLVRNGEHLIRDY